MRVGKRINTATKPTNGRSWIDLLAVVIAAASFAFLVTPQAFVLDDAYIALHSARVVLSGHDPIFGAPALAGVTSPAYVSLLVGLLRLGFSSGAQALRIATMLGVIAYATAVWIMTGVAGLRSSWLRAAVILVSIGSGVFGSTIVNVTNGLETGWAMAALVGLIAATAAGNSWAVGLLAGVLPALRPDMTPAAALLLTFVLWQGSWGHRTIAFGLALATTLAFALWMHGSTGAWLPDTIRAKGVFYAEGCLPVLVKSVLLAQGVGKGLAVMLPLSLGLLRLHRDRIGRIGLAAMAVSLAAYFVALPGSLTYSYYRYLYPLVAPWCCWGIVSTAARVRERSADVVLVSVALATTVVAFGTWIDQTPITREAAATANWVDTYVPPDAVLLVHDAGVISELAHRRAVDLVGLKSPASVDAHVQSTWPSCGGSRQTAVASIAREARASYAIVHTSWNRTFQLEDGLSSEGLRMEVVRHPEADGYLVYRISP